MQQMEIPENPDYGAGLFIRSVRLTTPNPNHIRLGMEDMGHAFQIDFDHDGHKITRLAARWIRHPLSTCPGAPDALQALVGCPLGENVLAPQDFTDSAQQCTHMFDMMRVGITHAWLGRPDRRYDIVIRDQIAGPQWGELLLDGTPVMAIAVEDGAIQAPDHCRGANIFKGFGAWAKANLSVTELEYVFLLQRGFFIAHGRRRDYSVTNGRPAAVTGMREGVCYASQPALFSRSVRLDTAKDFSDTPEQVLSFFPLQDPT